MRALANPKRVISIIDRIIAKLELDLSGLTVLTEAASGPFVCTPLLAARAGAQVIAITRNSSYGTADEVISYVREWADRYNVSDRILVTSEPVIRHAHKADILTNLGFIRPISAEIVHALPSHAVIPLMWEAWEFRSDDLDFAACRYRGIPVVGTCETHPALRIFDYLGIVAVKLLLEAEIEVVRSNIALISSDPFGEAIEACLTRIGADVVRIPLPELGSEWNFPDPEKLDALILAEHRSQRELIGENGGIPPDLVERIGSPVIHICGNIDDKALSSVGGTKYPARQIAPRFMTVTTDYCGPRPVINLHAGGLKVGEILVRARKAGMTSRQAEDLAAATGLASLLPKELP
jgi:hypothetical protein